MKDIGSRLREMRIKNGLTQDELAEKLHCGAKAISRYESDENLSKVYDFIRVCECLGDISYIITGKKCNHRTEITPEEKKILSAYKNLNNSDKQRIVDFILEIGEYDSNSHPLETQLQKIYLIPVYQQDVAAGSGQLGFDQKHEMEEFSEKNMPNKISYGIKIKGISMQTDDEYNIPDKSTVLVTTELDYGELVGEAVIVNINGTLVCKEYNIAEDGHLWLKSRNLSKSNEDKHIYSMDGVKIIGRVVKVINYK